MRRLGSLAWIAVLVLTICAGSPPVAETTSVTPPTVERMQYNIPHITAGTDYDVIYFLGLVHAQDRFFQMDVQRRLFSGTLAELVGPAALPQDIQMRTLGLRRAAEASMAVVSPESMEWLSAYTDGVNSYLEDETLPLPPEYGALELTRASIPLWQPVDSLTVAKGLAFGLSFELSDIDLTEALLTFQGAGQLLGFDGTALFFEDLYRNAPFDPAISIPDFLQGKAAQDGTAGNESRPLPEYLDSGALRLIQSYRNKVARIPILRNALERRAERAGSNWWIVSGALSDSGFPMLANDPHLALNTPATFYEVYLEVVSEEHPMEVYGVTFPGAPMVVHGCTTSVCWGSTVNPMDVTDVYLERIALNASDRLPAATQFGDGWELIVRIRQRYHVNQVDNGVADDAIEQHVPLDDGGFTFIVPRRNNGPIVGIDSSDMHHIQALSVQYTGWGPTREADAFRIWARATDLDDFKEGLQYFDVGSQNWGYADVNGNIAYFTSAEMPIREDLQNLNAPDGGVPPFLLRDGTHQLQHEWLPLVNPQPGQALPYEILPFAEMPHVENPDSGYILNANNDPVGTSVDNNPLNQLRPGGGLYYLSRDYARGYRMGRLQQLFDDALAGGGTLGMDDLMAFQANNQLLDAEFFAPLLVAAFDGGGKAGLKNGNPNLPAAIGYLRDWDFSTPTGIAAGFDPGDDPAALPDPSQAQIDASVAATIYAAWRSEMVQLVIDTPLEMMGIPYLAPPSDLAMTALRNLVENIDTNHGMGASGLPFIPEGQLDAVMLASLSSALDLLASDAFAPAFANSTDLADYRWGYLHRIVFDHPLGGPFNLPPAGGLADLGPDLPGVARSGGFGALDASSHSARADSVNEFMFGHGPARRFVGHLTPHGVTIHQTIPGGASGVIGSPHQSDALLLWLTNRYHEQTIGGAAK